MISLDYMILWTVLGFSLAAYSVIANDSVQTLGTFMNSNRDIRWQWMWLAASAVLVFTLVSGWYFDNGDISHGRLTKIAYIQPEWYHALAPLLLLVLTRIGIPVSTSFLVLSVFASSFVLEKMLVKSFVGYGLAAIFAYIVWVMLARVLNEKTDILSKGHEKMWRLGQWLSTGLLWYMWLSHDVSNIAVFLPRKLDVEILAIVCIIFVILLGFMFYERGGKIQNIVKSKTDTRYVRSATLIDLVYAFVLWFFKMYNNIPMSTTFVFVGLLAGREFAIASVMKQTEKFRKRGVFPIVGMDFLKLMVGIAASVALVIFINLIK